MTGRWAGLRSPGQARWARVVDSFADGGPEMTAPGATAAGRFAAAPVVADPGTVTPGIEIGTTVPARAEPVPDSRMAGAPAAGGAGRAARGGVAYPPAGAANGRHPGSFRIDGGGISS